MALASADTLFNDILDFLAASPSAEQLVNYQPPEPLQQRLSDLLQANRTQGLTVDERHELDEFLRMNRFMSRLRLKARKHLST